MRPSEIIYAKINEIVNKPMSVELKTLAAIINYLDEEYLKKEQEEKEILEGIENEIPMP